MTDSVTWLLPHNLYYIFSNEHTQIPQNRLYKVVWIMKKISRLWRRGTVWDVLTPTLCVAPSQDAMFSLVCDLKRKVGDGQEKKKPEGKTYQKCFLGKFKDQVEKFLLYSPRLNLHYVSFISFKSIISDFIVFHCVLFITHVDQVIWVQELYHTLVSIPTYKWLEGFSSRYRLNRYCLK